MTNRDKYEPSDAEVEAAARAMHSCDYVDDEDFSLWASRCETDISVYYKTLAKRALIAAHKARQEVEG